MLIRLTNDFSKVAFVAIGFVLLMVSSTSVRADDTPAEIKSVLEKLTGRTIPGEAVIESATNGIYEIHLDGTAYHTYMRDGVLLIGEAFDVSSGTNLTQAILNRSVAEVVNQISEEQMIIFPAVDSKRYVSVFTDIDCGYCRRFHREVPQLTDAGLEVRYIAFPRSGVGTSSYDKYVTVWCSPNQQAAMTSAKDGSALAPLTCENPVAEQYESGANAGIRGTPTLVVDDGTVIGGYVPAEELLSRLGLN